MDVCCREQPGRLLVARQHYKWHQLTRAVDCPLGTCGGRAHVLVMIALQSHTEIDGCVTRAWRIVSQRCPSRTLLPPNGVFVHGMVKSTLGYVS